MSSGPFARSQSAVETSQDHIYFFKFPILLLISFFRAVVPEVVEIINGSQISRVDDSQLVEEIIKWSTSPRRRTNLELCEEGPFYVSSGCRDIVSRSKVLIEHAGVGAHSFIFEEVQRYLEQYPETRLEIVVNLMILGRIAK